MQWPHGKALGGSSIINYMIMVRGNSFDYDKWAQLGNPGWSYKEVLPYFKKLEDAHIKIKDEKYRGKGGYLTVTDVPYRTEAVKSYVQAAQEAGYLYVDYNGKHQLGVSLYKHLRIDFHIFNVVLKYTGCNKNIWKCRFVTTIHVQNWNTTYNKLQTYRKRNVFSPTFRSGLVSLSVWYSLQNLAD